MQTKTYVLISFFGLNIQQVLPFSGPKAKETAEHIFEQETGISYKEYRRRRIAGEDNNDILDEDEEGTEIYVLEHIVCDEVRLNLNRNIENQLWKHEDPTASQP